MTYKRIRELREDHDLTQKYMAHYLNVIQRTYSRYERGERIIPPDVLCKIADFYNVSVDYLLERTDTKQPYPPSHRLFQYPCTLTSCHYKFAPVLYHLCHTPRGVVPAE